MSKRFVTVYSIVAFLILIFSVVLFSFSIYSELQQGSGEADLSFSWITRSTSLSAVTDGFMSDSFVTNLTDTCQKSRSLVAFMITTPTGVTYAWPDRSSLLSYEPTGTAKLGGSSLFMRTFSAELDIPQLSGPTVVATAVMYILRPSAIFDASRMSFMITLALILITLIVIIAYTPEKHVEKFETFDNYEDSSLETDKPVYSIPSFEEPINTVDSSDDYGFPYNYEENYDSQTIDSDNEDLPYGGEFIDTSNNYETNDEIDEHVDLLDEDVTELIDEAVKPEGLYSPVTGLGWQQYLIERLDSELVRAASSEQDLSLMILRVSATKHTDLVSRKIAQELLEHIKFRDMAFEFGSDGFAGIFQNISLNQAMKIADDLYEGVDALLREAEIESQITIGITTRTARLLSADRMIEEAVIAAAKAVAEPDLPIVAFRANPDKYRDFVAGNL